MVPAQQGTRRGSIRTARDDDVSYQRAARNRATPPPPDAMLSCCLSRATRRTPAANLFKPTFAPSAIFLLHQPTLSFAASYIATTNTATMSSPGWYSLDIMVIAMNIHGHNADFPSQSRASIPPIWSRTGPWRKVHAEPYIEGRMLTMIMQCSQRSPSPSPPRPARRCTSSTSSSASRRPRARAGEDSTFTMAARPPPPPASFVSLHVTTC